MTEVLEGTFIANRYNPSTSPHLKMIFDQQPNLKAAWAKNETLVAETNHNSSKEEVLESFNYRQYFYYALVRDNHLGEIKTKYPFLYQGLISSADKLSEIEKSLQHMIEEKKNLLQKLREKGQLDSLDKKSKKDIEQDLYHLKFEKAILDLCHPDIPEDEQRGQLDRILKSVPEDAEFYHDVRKLMASKPEVAKIEEWLACETDHPNDLLLIGTETESCQRINGSASYNKCLLSYILDGKNKAMVVKDKNGKIVARCILRLLWDDHESKPVLFRERFYINQGAGEARNLLERLCKQKSQALKLPLLCSSEEFLNTKDVSLYHNEIYSLGGRFHFEYVDAEGGGAKLNKFTLRHCVLVT